MFKGRRQRAKPSGRTLTEADAAIIKGMLMRGDRQHDIAALFGVNGGRIAEIATGKKFAGVPAASASALPEPCFFFSIMDRAALTNVVHAFRDIGEDMQRLRRIIETLLPKRIH